MKIIVYDTSRGFARILEKRVYDRFTVFSLSRLSVFRSVSVTNFSVLTQHVDKTSQQNLCESGAVAKNHDIQFY